MAFYQSSKVSSQFVKYKMLQIIPLVGIISFGPFKQTTMIKNIPYSIFPIKEISVLGIISVGPFKSSVKSATNLIFEVKK